MKDNKLPLIEIILLVTGFTALVTVQIIFQRPLNDDERDYLSNVALLHQYGPGKNYLVHLVGSAGPLYPVVHFLFEPITRLDVLYVRWINTGFLTGAIYFIYRTISLFNFPLRFYSFYTMAIPMTYVTGGMALTEMPALFFFSVSIYLLIKSTAAARPPLLQVILAGCCMSLAILGRQPYLLTLAAFPVLFIPGQNLKRSITLLVVTLIFSVALPCYVFFTWKGLVPTIESQLYKDIAQAGISYRPDFFLLCIFYFAMSMLIIAPGLFRIKLSTASLTGWIACFVAIIAANFVFQWITLIPLKGLSEKIFTTPGQIYVFSNVCGSAVIFSSFCFLVSLYKHSRNMPNRKEIVFFALTALLVAAACIKITWGYSSRYAAQAIPSLVLLGSFFYKNTGFNIIRIIAGVIAGLIALTTYLLVLA
jgi:hypothetical protein